MADQTRREALAAAWDKMEETEDRDDVTTVDDGISDEDSPPLEVLDNESSDKQDLSTEKTGAEKEESEGSGEGKQKVEKDPKKQAKDDTQAKEVEAAQRQSQVKDKAPNSWKPLARESWAKIPADARAEINRRELEIQQSLSQTATIRKFANDFANVVNPYSHIIRAQNSTPLKAVQNLMQTAAGLYQGSQHQKAAIIAEILTNYGVDIQILDDYLSKNWNPGMQPGARVPQPEQMPQWAQRIHNFIDAQEQRQNQEKDRMKQAADAEIAKLENEPYFNDVKDDIADILEIAASKGRSMTLQQAYERAKLLNEDVQKAIKAQRLQNLQGKNKQNQQHITRARRAASTLSGAPQGKVSGKENKQKTRREMLSEAWDAASE